MPTGSYVTNKTRRSVILTPMNVTSTSVKLIARVIAAAPRLLKALEISEQAIEEATDIMHYEDGLPVTALEGWEIERAYGALCSVLVEVHQAIAAANGEQP